MSGLVLAEDVFTTLAFVVLNDRGERSFSFARKPGADTCLRPEELNAAVLDSTRVLHVGSLSLTDEPARSATFAAVERAKAAGAVISYDPNYRAALWPDAETAAEHMRSMLPYVDVMKLSDEETALLTDEPDPAAAAAVLLSRGGDAGRGGCAGGRGRRYAPCAGLCCKRGGHHRRGRRLLGRLPPPDAGAGQDA